MGEEVEELRWDSAKIAMEEPGTSDWKRKRSANFYDELNGRRTLRVSKPRTGRKRAAVIQPQKRILSPASSFWGCRTNPGCAGTLGTGGWSSPEISLSLSLVYEAINRIFIRSV